MMLVNMTWNAESVFGNQRKGHSVNLGLAQRVLRSRQPII